MRGIRNVQSCAKVSFCTAPSDLFAADVEITSRSDLQSFIMKILISIEVFHYFFWGFKMSQTQVCI